MQPIFSGLHFRDAHLCKQIMDGNELKRKFYEEERLHFHHGRIFERRDQESSEDRVRRLAIRRERETQRRELESPEEKAQRLAVRRDREAQRRGLESPEERTKRLAARRKKDALRRSQESADQRSDRLAVRRAREAQRRGQESSVQKFQRLAIRRIRERDSHIRGPSTSSERPPLSVESLGSQCSSFIDPKSPLLLKRDGEVALRETTIAADKCLRFATKQETPLPCHVQDTQHNFLIPSGNLCGPHTGFTNYVSLEEYFPSSLWSLSEARTNSSVHVPRGICN